MKHLASLPILLTVCCAVALSGCSKKKKGDFAGVSGDLDYISGTPLSDRNEGVNFLGANVDRSRFAPVYFAFDSSSVDSGEMGKVQEIASFMNSGNHEIIVAGFTDERGTAEYNRSLGERRAQAVREALIESGVNPGSIQTVSFGEELPADPGSGESAWQKNRRAEFGVVR
jgi:peptidoglycan-associated lipoprotein